jgi:alkylation response protein AidB-like acyl-CoA dehydrogenase
MQAESGPRTAASKVSGTWRITGRKRAALGADRADAIIVTAATSGEGGDVAVFIVPSDAPGLKRHGFGLLGSGSAADIELDGVEVADDALTAAPGEALPVLNHVRDAGIAAVCAEAVGAMAAMHEATVEYLKTRRQFGTPIGSFQVLQHRAVDMFIALEQARSMALLGALTVDSADADSRARALAACKVLIGRSARFIGQQAVQLHGGMGMTRECQIGRYFRRVTAIDALFGNSDHHLARLARMGSLFGSTRGAQRD